MNMTLSEELTWRGQIKDKTFIDVGWLNEPKTFYLGADCSAKSLTIGNLAVYMLARRLRQHGWKTVLLVGGATSLIGDPGGKDDERALKGREEIQVNVAAIKRQVQQLFSDLDFELVDNFEWFQHIGYLEFLRDIGKHYGMTELLQRDFIASRIGEGGSGISYAEFSYSLIQGYDYWHLYKNKDVVLQIGGSDQWGNMLSGVPLIRKKEDAEVHALSMPLVINKTTGKKFGKSEDGAVWLDEQLTSVYKFYQFWLNVDDGGVEDYLKIYTLLTKAEVEAVINNFNDNRASRLAQKTLAYEVTKIVHGHEKAESVKRVTEVLFNRNADYGQLTEVDFQHLKTELPVTEVDLARPITTLLVETQLVASNSDAQRQKAQGAIYANGVQLPEEKVSFTADDLLLGKYIILRRGKNSNALLQIIQ